MRLRVLLSGSVDHWCLSFEVGAIKPDPAIFDAVLQRTGTPKGHVWMVGARMDADVVGAQRVGIQAMLLDRTNAARARFAVLNSLRELIGLL